MFDAVTYGAAVGAAKKYTDEHSGSDDAVKYTEQSLTTEQQAQARENIGAAASADIPTDAVKYTAQTLTDAQKTQARTNIGVVQPDWNAYNSGNPDFIKNKPLVKVGQGTGGNLISGTGLENNTNEAKKLNSIAHGRNVTANGNYSIAVGQYVQANNDYEIAYGKCNQSNADTAFSIGDGADTQNRHNLMELKTDGRMFLNGNETATKEADTLKLGQICGIVGSSNSYEIKFGFSQIFGTTPSVTFSASNAVSTGIYKIYQFGDFVAYQTAADSGVTVAIIAGGDRGISRSGKWIMATNCMRMFYECAALTSLNLSNFDTSKVSTMANMFYNCLALTSLDLSSFDTSNVTNMAGMFYGCSALTALDLSSFDTSKVTTMYIMFYNCLALTSLNLSSFDTSNVVNMYNMFLSCRTLTFLDLSNFDTSNVGTMGGMFYGCLALTSLDLSNFDTSNVTNMAGMFAACTALATLDISSFDMGDVTEYADMFKNAGTTTLKCPKINPHDDIPLPRTLYSQDGTAYTNLPVTTGTSIELRQSWT